MLRIYIPEKKPNPKDPFVNAILKGFQSSDFTDLKALNPTEIQLAEIIELAFGKKQFNAVLALIDQLGIEKIKQVIPKINIAKASGDLNDLVSPQTSLLHLCVARAQPKLLKIFIEQIGLNVNIIDAAGDNPAHWLAYIKPETSTDKVKSTLDVLVQANPLLLLEQNNLERATPFDKAVTEKQETVLKLLVELVSKKKIAVLKKYSDSSLYWPRVGEEMQESATPEQRDVLDRICCLTIQAGLSEAKNEDIMEEKNRLTLIDEWDANADDETYPPSVKLLLATHYGHYFSVKKMLELRPNWVNDHFDAENDCDLDKFFSDQDTAVTVVINRLQELKEDPDCFGDIEAQEDFRLRLYKTFAVLISYRATLDSDDWLEFYRLPAKDQQALKREMGNLSLSVALSPFQIDPAKRIPTMPDNLKQRCLLPVKAKPRLLYMKKFSFFVPAFHISSDCENLNLMGSILAGIIKKGAPKAILANICFFLTWQQSDAESNELFVRNYIRARQEQISTLANEWAYSASKSKKPR